MYILSNTTAMTVITFKTFIEYIPWVKPYDAYLKALSLYIYNFILNIYNFIFHFYFNKAGKNLKNKVRIALVDSTNPYSLKNYKICIRCLLTWACTQVSFLHCLPKYTTEVII